jgi:cation diffusion facilitator CzcD-associated flavoprotein CzcO
MGQMSTVYDVAIVGAGFGGLGTAVKLREAGIDSFVVLDKASDVGGTWRDNTYPGAACDVPSNLYSYSFRPRSWMRKYSPQPEILDYLHQVVAVAGLARHLRLGAEVSAAQFDDRAGIWTLTLTDAAAEPVRARAVVFATGQLNRPALPAVTGVDSFCGPAWHSARWRADVDLRGQRVGVIGTGASAIQLVPRVAEQASSVTVFCRSAPYVLPKGDRPYSPGQRRRFAGLPMLQAADRARIFARGELVTNALTTAPWMRSLLERSWRRYLESQISDPALRAACTPDYVIGCKRILLADDWYSTLEQEHVHLVTDRIEAITPAGVRTADGVEHEVDVLIYATGFQATDFLQPISIIGRGGAELHTRWQDGARAYLGVTVPDFPNMFLLYGPNTNLGSNSIILMLEAQIGYVVDALRTLTQQRLAWLDVRADVEDAFHEWIVARSKRTAWETGCHSWYTTAAGVNTNNWPASVSAYRQRLRRVNVLDYEVLPLPADAGTTQLPTPLPASGQTVPVRQPVLTGGVR